MQRLKKYGLGFFLLALLLAAAILIYQKLHPKTLPANLIEGTGRIDGDLINLGSRYPGRITSMRVSEGSGVHKGDIVATLTSEEYEAKRTGIEREIDAKKKEFSARKRELQIAQKTIPLALSRARAGLEAKRSALSELQSGIRTQRSLVAQAKRDYRRIRKLYLQKLIQRELLEKAKLKLTTERDRLQALEHKEKQLLQAIEIAENDLAEAKANQQKIAVLEEGIGAFGDAIRALEASKAEIDAVIRSLTLRSPIDGFVVEKIANVGEVVAPGMPLVTLISPEDLYLKIFVDTIENGKIKLGDKGVIFLDAAPDHPIEAKVTHIAKRAEFTPKEVSVRSDRIQRVFAVYLKPLHPDPLLKLGIPAIGVVSLDGRGLPKSLNDIPVL